MKIYDNKDRGSLSRFVETFEVADITVDDIRYALMNDNMIKINFPNVKNTSFVHINDRGPFLNEKDPMVPNRVVMELKKSMSNMASEE